MFPNEIIFNLTFYDILIFIGIIAGFVMFRHLLKIKNVPDKQIDSYFTIMLITVASGFVFAIVMQMLYDFIATKELTFTGMTYLGGFVGASIVFLIIYYFNLIKIDKSYFGVVVSAAIVSLLLGHFFGRLGCFTAGCCYGKPTTSFLGIKFPHLSQKVHPTQLYEAAGLLVMFFVANFLFKKDKETLSFYLISYGVFRFLIEFLRDDERGSFVPGLSPSQFLSLIMIVIGVVLIIRKIKGTDKKLDKHFSL